MLHIPEDIQLIELRNKMLKFLSKDLHATSHNRTADILRKQLEKIVSTKESAELSFTQSPPKPILPKENNNNASLLDFDSEELARQITIVDLATFKKIRPAELLNSNWCKQDKLLRSPNVCALISRFQFLSGWVASEIVNTPNLEERVQKISKLIDVADVRI